MRFIILISAFLISVAMNPDILNARGGMTVVMIGAGLYAIWGDIFVETIHKK